MKPVLASITQSVAGVVAVAAVWIWPQVGVGVLPVLVIAGLVLAWVVRRREQIDAQALRAVVRGDAVVGVDPQIADRIAQWRQDLIDALASQREADGRVRELAARNTALETSVRDAQLTLLGARAELDQLRESWPQRQLARALERARGREQRASLVRALQPGLEDVTRLAQSTGCRPQCLQLMESIQLQAINAQLALERRDAVSTDVAAAQEALMQLCVDVTTLADDLRTTSAQDRRAMMESVEAMRAAVDQALDVMEPDETDRIPAEVYRLALDLRRATLQLSSAMRAGVPADEGAQGSMQMLEDQG